MSQLQLRLLGAPQVELRGESVALTVRKAIALLAYLGVETGDHPRDELATLLWPAYNQKRARSNLRYQLWSLRKSLGEEWFHVDRESARLAPHADIWVDVAHFARHMTAWRDHDHGSGPPCQACILRLEQAVALSRGAFLQGFTLDDSAEFDDWQFFVAESHQQELAEALHTLVRHYSRIGDYPAATGHARRWLALDPLHEPAHRSLMQLYAQGGQQAAALRQYEVCVRLLHDELGVEPEAETSELASAIRSRQLVPGDVSDSHVPSARSRSSSPAKTQSPAPVPQRRHNLPSQPEPLIGRQEETAEIEDLLAEDGSRLVTLTGPGGVGKTRLALQVAQTLFDRRFPYVFFVPLAVVRHHNAVPSAIANALALWQVQEQTIEEHISSYLRDKRSLLVLDNFEHLLEAGVFVADLLARCPTLQVLATSREPLSLRHEQQFPIGPLALPADDDTDRMKVRTSAAVTLFIQRARAVAPDLVWNDDEVRAAEEICRRLDGLPLAIELAAARVKTFPPRSLSQRLAVDDSALFRYLGRGPQDAPQRHQAVDVAISWSYDLLNKGERRLFRLLSVFPGGAALDGVEQVAHVAGTLAQVDIFETLASLVDKSLIFREIQFDGQPRFRMLHVIQAYALLLPDTEEESESARQALARYCVDLAEEAAEPMRGSQQLLWLQRMELERANIEAVMQWILESQNIELGLRLADAMGEFWVLHGNVARSLEWVEHLLAIRPDQHSRHARAGALLTAARLGIQLLDSRPKNHLEESLAIYQEAGDLTRVAWVWIEIGWSALVAQMTGTPSARMEAEAALHEALHLARHLQDELIEAVALSHLGEVLYTALEYETAAEFCRRSLEIYARLGNRYAQRYPAQILGRISLQRGQLEAAGENLGLALELAQEMASPRDIAHIAYFLGRTAYAAGDFALSRFHFDQSLRACREHGIKTYNWAHTHGFLAFMACQEGDLDAARFHLGEVMHFFRQVDSDVGFTFALLGWAAFAAARGDYAGSIRLAAAALRLRQELMDSLLPPSERALAADLTASAYAALSEKEAQAAVEAAKSMTLTGALTYAEELPVGG